MRRSHLATGLCGMQAEAEEASDDADTEEEQPKPAVVVKQTPPKPSSKKKKKKGKATGEDAVDAQAQAAPVTAKPEGGADAEDDIDKLVKELNLQTVRPRCCMPLRAHTCHAGMSCPNLQRPGANTDTQRAGQMTM